MVKRGGRIMNKFYYLKDMTQEDLNQLALERNTLQQENQKYKEVFDKVREYIKSKINKSFKCDYSLDNSNSNDRLFTETGIELEIIDNILKKTD